MDNFVTYINHKDPMILILRSQTSDGFNASFRSLKKLFKWSRDALLSFDVMQEYNVDAIAKDVVDVFFTRCGLSGSFSVGQCYDGASVMSGRVGVLNTNWRSTSAKNRSFTVCIVRKWILLKCTRPSTTRIFITAKNFVWGLQFIYVSFVSSHIR